MSEVDESFSIGDKSEVAEGDLVWTLGDCVKFDSRLIFVVTWSWGLLSFSTNSSLARTGSARRVSIINDCGGIDWRGIKVAGDGARENGGAEPAESNDMLLTLDGDLLLMALGGRLLMTLDGRLLMALGGRLAKNSGVGELLLLMDGTTKVAFDFADASC